MLSTHFLFLLVPFVVRQKAKDITALLSDESRLKEERRSRNAMRDRMSGRGERNEAHTPVYEGPGAGDDDRDLQRALEESRRMAQNEGRLSNHHNRYVMQAQTVSH
jgi:epsin